MCFGLHPPIKVAVLTIVLQISYMATLLSADMGFQAHLLSYVKMQGMIEQIPSQSYSLFKTNSPHCDSVMAIGATNSFSETSRIVVSRLPNVIVGYNIVPNL